MWKHNAIESWLLFRLLEIRVLVRIRRRAAAEKTQWFCSNDCVPRARRNQDGIARADRPALAVELNLARAFENEIKFLCHLMIMPLRSAAGRDARFGQALILNGRIRAIEDGTNG